ncbi:MAG: sensor histidine kinase [Spirochaetales bacterium]
MRLKTQFAVLTSAVTLLPILFGVLFFGFQQAPRDPRAPTREFIASLLDKVNAGETLTIDIMKAEAENVGMPLREVALLQPDGKVLLSTFRHIIPGSQIQLNDLTPQTGANANRTDGRNGGPRPELKLMPIDSGRLDSLLILFDIQPFWTKQDIRNRNIIFISSFAFVIFAVAGVFSLFILRSISKAIKTLEKDTAIVATGDLDHEVAGSGNHEILLLAKSINLMRLNLKDMLVRRSKMLMGVSHDLKTPIALIQGYADALADNVAKDKETQGKYIQIIQRKAKQLEDLTGEIIDFLKIGGEGSISVQEVDLRELLRTLGQRFESDALLLKRRLVWGFGENAAQEPSFDVPTLAMNRLLVERALENLVTNAFKYSRDEGQIALRLVQIEGKPAFSVVDDGMGVAEEDVPYVFDAFYRGSHSRSDGGHGFGLTIVKAAADLHGWTVSIGKRRDGKSGTEALFVMA